MAVESPPLGIQATGATNPAEQFRRLVQTVLPVGTNGGIDNPGDLLVSAQGTPNNTVSVAVGGVIIPGSSTTSQGSYYGYNPSTYTPTALGAPDPTNPRHDLIVARVRDSNYSGVNNDWDIIPVAGTPAATPLDPTPPANSFILARVTIAASGGGLTITSGMLTDLRTSSSRSIYRARCYQATQQTIPNGTNATGFNATDYDPGASLGANVYTVKVKGIYLVTAQMRISNCTNAGRFVTQITVNGAAAREGGEVPATVTYYPSSVVSDQIALNIGDTVGVATFWSGTSQLSYVAGAEDCYMSVGLISPS